MSEDYASMDKPQLISMIHFLEIRDEESKKLDEQLKGEEEITSAIRHQPSDISHQNLRAFCLALNKWSDAP